MSDGGMGPLLVDVQGLTLNDEDKAVLRHPAVGGVILFTHNYESPGQLRDLVASIRAVRAGLLITVDHEGGRVQRFREGFTRLPAAGTLGQVYADAPGEGLALARAAGWVMAAELRALDIDLSFAPVLDLARGISRVIGDRAFHAEPVAVSALAGAYTEGMAEAGMAACGKHFPGHGAVAADSHTELPVDTRDMAVIRDQDLAPFQALIRDGLAAVMVAHVRFARMASEPASLSPWWIKGILREDLAFEGTVVCDDLSMNGATVGGSYPERARAALEAGCELLPVCNNREAVLTCLEAELPRPAARARKGAMRLHGRPAPGWEELRSTPRWRKASGALAALIEGGQG